jgi:protein involved in polysaccharide export with SLBB domain
MTKTWKTKFGPRRVRHDPPTVAEAVAAAQGLTDNVTDQIEIAASLMGVAQEEVREAVMAAASQPRRNIDIVAVGNARSPRSVIVERKPARRMVTNRAVNR